jgi:hypothetical protein
MPTKVMMMLSYCEQPRDIRAHEEHDCRKMDVAPRNFKVQSFPGGT